MRLTLPNLERSLRIDAEIRYRALSGSAVRYGLHFLDDGRPGVRAQLDEIGRYVAQRQAEILRWLGERRTR